MDNRQSPADILRRQMAATTAATLPNRCVNEAGTQDHLANPEPWSNPTLRTTSERFQKPNLRINELSTIRKLLEQCTIDATRREVICVLETACSHPEECIDCPYKNSLGECNRNERIADILLNRLGRVK